MNDKIVIKKLSCSRYRAPAVASCCSSPPNVDDDPGLARCSSMVVGVMSCAMVTDIKRRHTRLDIRVADAFLQLSEKHHLCPQAGHQSMP